MPAPSAARFLGYEITVASTCAQDQEAIGDRQAQPPVAQRDGRPARAQRPWSRPSAPRTCQRGKPACRNPMVNDDDYNIVGQIRGRVPGHRPVLPARRRRLPAAPAALGHGDLHAQDPGPQAPLDGDEDGGPPPGQNRDTARAAHVIRGQRRARRAGSHWSHGSAASRSSGRRTRSSPTASTPGPSTRARSWSPGYSRADASSASERMTCRFTTSASSPTSTSPASRSPVGHRSWPAIRRKTLVVCDACHDLIHGHPATPLTQ